MFSRKTLLLALAIVAVASLVVACGGGGSSGGGGGGESVTVTMTDFKFDPATLNATPGQTINLTVVNKGQTRHTFVLSDANVNIGADPGQSATASFKAPAQAGTYKFQCDVPGHADQGMVGQLVVK